jgi:predicted ATPase
MKRFILTGAPGSGKTAIIRQLELDGFSVVEEAATDVIALEQARGVPEPSTHPTFIDFIAELQRRRQLRAARETGESQFHDRSAICTAALAAYLGYPVSDTLARELKRIETEGIFQRRVFFIENLGFVTRPKPDGSALRSCCVSNGRIKRPIAISASNLFPLRVAICQAEWTPSSAPLSRAHHLLLLHSSPVAASKHGMPRRTPGACFHPASEWRPQYRSHISS